MNYFQQNLIAFKTILIKEILRFSRIWIQTIFPPVVTTALYLIIFGNLIGNQLGEVEGVRYIDYILPGVILMSIITNSYSNVVSSFFSAKFHRNIEEFIISPISVMTILLGYVFGGMARGLSVGIAVAIMSSFFADLQITHLFATLGIVLLTSMLFATAGLINAVYARSFDDISIIPTFVLTPLTYLGGIFYSIHMLPDFWQHASYLNPILYMINGFRYGLLGVSDIEISAAFSIIIVFILLLVGFAYYLLKTGVGVKQ